MRTTFIASGDSFITRHVAKDGYDGFDALCDLIGKYDVRFANLEMTFHRQEGYPSATSGGTWAMTDPTMLDDMLRYGFNIFNTANNHSGDFGQGGVSATIRHLNERKMVFAGTGNTLQEASRACYLETREARVALIGVTATLDPAAIAGGQGGDMIGRPGLNPCASRRFIMSMPSTSPWLKHCQTSPRSTRVQNKKLEMVTSIRSPKARCRWAI